MNEGMIPSFIEHHETLSSTNDRAWEILLARGRDADLAVVTADFQERGRGRAGRRWFAEKSRSLLMSLILVPESGGNISLLPLAAGVSVVKALKNCAGIDAKLKWPNDILYRGKKMGGVLVETKSSGGDIIGAVVGIGLNLEGEADSFPDEIRDSAVTLEMSSPGACDRDALLKSLFEQLHYYVGLCFSRPSELVADLSDVWAHEKGQPIKVSTGESVAEGAFAGIGPCGELFLKTASGETKIIQGEIVEIGEGPDASCP